MKPIKQQRLAIVLLTLMAASCRSIAADPPKVTGPASAASSVSGPISTSGFGKASFGMNFEDVQRALGPLSRKSDVGRCTIAEPAGGSGGASLHFLENRFVAVSSEGAATRSGIRLGTADAEATLLLKRFPSFQRLSDGQGQTQYLVVATPASAQDRLLRLSLNVAR